MVEFGNDFLRRIVEHFNTTTQRQIVQVYWTTILHFTRVKYQLKGLMADSHDKGTIQDGLKFVVLLVYLYLITQPPFLLWLGVVSVIHPH